MPLPEAKKKFKILKENKNKICGISLWRNLKNKQIYVGYSKNLRSRFYQYFDVKHLISCNSMYICRSLLKHGYSNFGPFLEILEYCDIKDLLERENHYLKLLKPDYNLCKVAYSRLGSQHS